MGLTKRCSACGQVLPVSAFGRNRSECDGLQRWCKSCAKAARKAKIQEQRSQPLFCLGCHQTLPADQFPKRRPKKLYCNGCRKARKAEYNRRFREEHRDELSAYLKEYRNTHEVKRPPGYNEKRAQSARERYANDPEYRAHVRALAAKNRANETPEQKARRRQYMREFQRRPEQVEKRRSRYREIVQNPNAYVRLREENNAYRNSEAYDRKERVRLARHERPEVFRNAENRRRARKKNATVESFDAESHVAFLRAWQQGRCYYCGEPMVETHVEHIVPLSRNGAHSRQNTVLACPACNLSKGSKILWKEWVPPRTGASDAVLPSQTELPMTVLSTFHVSDRESSSNVLTLLRLQNTGPMFFDFEWHTRRIAVVNISKSRAGEHKSVAARKCNVQAIDTDDARAFLEMYHLQGFARSTWYIGLAHEGTLVGVMGVSLRSGVFEISRVAFAGSVAGGLSRMFQFFLRNYYDGKSLLVSYTDPRIATGASFHNLGFVDMGEVPAQLLYVGPGGIFHRMSFMKAAMREKLSYFDESASEADNARFNGYYRIFPIPLRRMVYRP